MSLKIERAKPKWSSRFVRSLNRHPLKWTLGLLIPVYLSAFLIAFIVLVVDPRLHSPVITFLWLALAATIVMGYHWVMTRYQRVSTIAQIIHCSAGLLPIVGGFLVITFSRLVTL